MIPTDIKQLIEKYKSKIAQFQQQSHNYERNGKGGACIAINGEIRAYNAVISDLNKLNQ